MENKKFTIHVTPKGDCQLYQWYKEWCEFIDKKEEGVEKDFWTIIPAIPQYQFKNLSFKQEPNVETDKEVQINLTYTYDEFKLIDDICDGEKE